jgi:hypothetical protein
MVGWPLVRFRSGAKQTHQQTARKKDLQMQAFW